MPDTPGLELESLFLRIYTQGQDQFAAAVRTVREGADRIEKSLGRIPVATERAVGGLAAVTGAVESLGAALQSTAQILTGSAIGQLTASLGALSSNAITLNLSRLAKGIGDMARTDVTKTAENLRLLAVGLGESRLANKSVQRTAGNITELAKSLTGFTDQVGTGDTLRAVFTNIGEGIYQLGSKLLEAKLHYKTAGAATAGITNLVSPIQQLAAVAPSADAIKDKIVPSIEALGTALTKSKLSNKTAYSAIPTIGLLGQAINQMPIAAGKVDGLKSVMTWLGDLGTLLQGKTLTAAGAKPAIKVITDVGNALSQITTARIGNMSNNITKLVAAMGTMSRLNAPNISAVLGVLKNDLQGLGPAIRAARLGGTVAFTNVANNITQLGNALPSFNAVRPNRLSAVLDVLTSKLPGFGQAIRDAGLGGTVRIARVAANLTAFTQSLTGLTTLTPAQLQASALAITSWVKTLTANVNPAQLAVLMAMGKALTAMQRAGAAGGALPNVNMQLTATQQIAQKAGRSIGGLSSSFNQLGRSAIGARTNLTLTKLTLAGFAGFSLIQFGRFDEMFARMEARMGRLTDMQRQRLRSGVLNLSGQRVTGADQLASALGILHATGMNQPMAAQALPIIEDFAQIAGIEAPRAARTLTSVLGALGMASMDATRDLRNLRDIADAFTHTSQIADTTVEELSEAFSGRFVAALRQVGWSLRDGLALITAYAQANVRGADAGNRASVVLQSLEHALVGHMHAWQALGLTVEEFQRLMRAGPAAVFSELEKRLQGLTPVQQRARLELMGFESRVTQALYPILGLAESMRLVSDGMRDVSGVSERAAEIIRASFGAQIKILWNNIKAMAIDIGDTLAPAIGWLSQHLKTLTDWFRSLSAPAQRLIVWGALIATIAGPLAGVAATLLGILGTLLSINAIVIGLGAGLGIITLGMIGGWKSIGAEIDRAWTSLKTFGNTLGDIAEKGLGFLVNWRENLKALTDWLENQGQMGYRDLFEIIDSVSRQATVVISDSFQGIARAFSELVDTIGRLWTSFWENEAGRAVREGLSRIGANFTSWLSQVTRLGSRTTGIGELGILSQQLITTGAGPLGARDLRDLTGPQLENTLASIRRAQTATAQEALRMTANATFARRTQIGHRQESLQLLEQEVEAEQRRRSILSDSARLGERITRALGPGANRPAIVIPTIGQSRARQLMTAASLVGGMSPFGAAAINMQPLTAFPNLPTFNFGGTRRPPDREPMRAAMNQAAIFALAGTGARIPQALFTQLKYDLMRNLLPRRTRPPFPERAEGESLYGGIGAAMREPGREFRSLSLSRFVLGGAATARIEQQVRDTQLDKRVQNANEILGAIGRNTAETNRILQNQPPRREPPQDQNLPQGLGPS